MCGIVGIAGTRDVAPVILDALRRLEYRGYDSAGIATLVDGHIDRRRSSGKLNKLGDVLHSRPLHGHTGIGHTRWATHGAPTETNAHPHASKRVAIVHNGIVENFRELRDELKAAGHTFESQTDSEVAVHLVTDYLDKGLSPSEAAQAAVRRLTGAYSLAMIFTDHDGLMIGARKGAPLAVGYGTTESYLGSDAFALAPFTNKVAYLEDGDVVVIKGPDITIYDSEGRPTNREVKTTSASAALVDKGGKKHFMAKEIHEQPEVIGHTLAHYLDPAGPVVQRQGVGLRGALSKASRLTISACGTAFYAGMVGKYWFEKLARLPVESDVASELRYRDVIYPKDGAALFVSQSGETADTLAALREAKAQGQTTIAIVNVAESSIAREADIVLPTFAGPEIGVASTKAFTCQLAALASFAIAAGVARGTLSEADEKRLCAQLLAAPRLVAEFLKQEPKIEQLGQEIAKATDVLYMGRGPSYPLALEGALKLKEISYIHAEGYAAGEMKHGPIALIDENVPVVVIAPHDALFEKTISNMQEVMARGGKVLLISDKEGIARAGDVWASIQVPDADPFLAPILYAIPVQLLSYYAAIAKGTDVDQPRNLAKSVTVE
ncbi:MAG: glutamine--fructose-6-phosphate transaminase (isomerizing) [Alphaproteobacteria bacterium]|nr:glutamine--fructose-6-phosphate transaminase (isomerizing) [Alphaproteobacteria bacterium]MBL6937125.1 glutamine--fructose-6-phosphate transaminase (isomerizing) [Alphaproteobacteria bacterium]MBL7096313.1 glutamine--fructose-6-phosphate transaminase (isomerizing) [Alphaproteobacteria bacterium]